MSEYGSGRKTAFIVVLALFVIECAAFALLSWSGQTAGKSVAIAVSGLFLAALFFFIHKFLVKNEKYVKATGSRGIHPDKPFGLISSVIVLELNNQKSGGFSHGSNYRLRASRTVL